MNEEQQAAIRKAVNEAYCTAGQVGHLRTVPLSEAVLDTMLAAHLKALEAAGYKLIPVRASGETINAMADVIRLREGYIAAITAQILWDDFVIAARPR